MAVLSWIKQPNRSHFITPTKELNLNPVYDFYTTITIAQAWRCRVSVPLCFLIGLLLACSTKHCLRPFMVIDIWHKDICTYNQTVILLNKNTISIAFAYGIIMILLCLCTWINSHQKRHYQMLLIYFYECFDNCISDTGPISIATPPFYSCDESKLVLK